MSVAAAPATDLQIRVERRRRDLISEIVEHKKNSSRAGAADAIDRGTQRLADLARIVKSGVVDGWAALGPDAKRALDEWMSR